MNSMQNLESMSRLKFSRGSVSAAVVIIGVFYLISEHAAHALAALPYLLLLLCPLMHLFMHRGGHGGGHNGSHGGPPTQGSEKE